MCRMFLLFSVWGLSIVASLPIAALAADPSGDDGDSTNGPILVAPQNDRPAAAQEQAASSRRQWLDRRAPSLGSDSGENADNGKTAQRLAYDTTLINDYPLLHGIQPGDQPDDPAGRAPRLQAYAPGLIQPFPPGNMKADQAAPASRAARAAAWCGQRLKRALIEVHGAAITYSCEQPDAKAGPKLLQPQQAKPIAALADADVENLQLDPDEPAKVILDIREQVGPKLFEGTIFEDTGWRARASAETPCADHRAQLVRCIRDMAQNRAQCDDRCEYGHCEFDACSDTADCSCPATCTTLASAVDAEPSTSPSTVPALRQASRQLDKLAESLEEQKLYDRADELRAMAQQLREQARGSESEMPIERSARK